MQMKILTITLIFSFLAIAGSHFVSSVFAEQKMVYVAKIFLLDGWNLISLPVDPKENLPASKLLNSINQQKGLATTIARWENGRWEEYVSRPNGQVYGADFPIEVGTAYFVRSYNKFGYQVTGTDVADQKLALKTGYNFIGLPKLPLESTEKASGLISQISGLVSNASPEVSQFVSGLFQTHTVREGKPYGADFKLDRFHGYVIKVDQPATIDIK